MNLFPAEDQRLKELILHIAHDCGDMRAFDASLLHRILFQAEFLHFRRFGFPITGHTYRRGILSPVPRAMARVCRAMIGAGEIEFRELHLGDGLHVRKILRPLREPSLRIFDGGEMALVDSVMRSYREAGALGLNWPDFLGIDWELAAYREEIPYPLALVAARGPADRASRLFRTDRSGQTVAA